MIKNRAFLWFALFSALGAVSAQMATARSLAPGHVPKVVPQLTAIGDLPDQTQLKLAIGLPLHNTQALQTLLHDLYDPASPLYHHYLTPAEFTARFGPTEQDYQAVTAFAQAHHLAVTGTHPNRMLLDVSGASSDVGKAFAIHLRRYNRPNGTGEFYAPDTEPVAPDDVPILDISGLSNYRPPHPLVRQNMHPDKAHPDAGSGPSGNYMGGDFRAAYTPGVSLTGTGQIVGLVEFDGFYASDISSYESQAGLLAVPVDTVLLDSYSGAPTTGSDSGNPEVSLDIEMSVSMAPGLSEIISYEAGPYGSPNDILNRIVSDNLAKTVACCWSWVGGPAPRPTDTLRTWPRKASPSFAPRATATPTPPVNWTRPPMTTPLRTAPT